MKLYYILTEEMKLMVGRQDHKNQLLTIIWEFNDLLYPTSNAGVK